MVSEGPPEQNLAPKNSLFGATTTATSSAIAGSVSAANLQKNGNAQGANPAQTVKETHRICIDYNPVSGRKQLNTYEIVRELGRGEHGRVKLGYNLHTHEYVAIKLLNRNEKPRLGRPRGSSTEEKIHREIAILKKCSHPNIVKLLEVLDDESSRKIYLVLEYCEKGEIRWQNSRGGPALSREKARSVARNVVLGLEYLHANGIIHRDIKPANLLVSADDVVKISDFGVSYAVTGDACTELELAKTVGTPAFFAPELCVPTEISDKGEKLAPPVGAKVDVWAFGVTLYCLLYGFLPFEADNEYELFRVIANENVYFPEPGEDQDLVLANNLLKKLLDKSPKARPSMKEIKEDPWLLKELQHSQKSEYLNSSASRIEVSVEEVDQAVKGVSITNRIKQGLSRIAEQLRTRSKSQTRTVSSSSAVASGNASSKLQSLSQSPPRETPISSSTSTSIASTVSSPSSLDSEVTGMDDDNATSSGTEQPRGRPLSRASIQSTTPTTRHAKDSIPTKEPSLDQAGNASSRGGLGMGLMPMNLADAGSLSSSKAGSLEDVSAMSPLGGSTRLPELDIPRLDDHFWDSHSSSSSDEDDSGELTLVVSRNRSRSLDRANMARRVSHTN